MPSPTRPARRDSIALVGLAALVAITAGCGGDQRSAERFCSEVAEHRSALVEPQLAYEDDIEPLLDLYRSIGDVAPLAVEEDWDQLVAAYETASSVVPGDTAAEQEALAAIYSSEKSAAAIDRWLRANCAVDIGPVFTIVPQDPVTAPPPTVPTGTPPPSAP